MKVTKKKLPDGRLQLEAVADAGEVEKALNNAALDFARRMNVASREDRDLKKAVEEQMGIKDLDSVVENQALEILAPYALDKLGIIPSFPPEPMAASIMKRGKPFSFRMFVSPKPDFELSSYEPVEFDAQKFEPDLSQVQRDLADMADRYAAYESNGVGGIVEKGTNVKLAIEADIDGERLTGLSTEGRTFTAGEGYMPQGFEDAVMGMAVGETKEFTFEGPGVDEDYNEITETVHCIVTALEIQDKVSATIDDKWVQTYMPMYRDYEDMVKNMEEGCLKSQRDNYDAYLAGLAVQELGKRFVGKIDDAVYETAKKGLIQNLKQQATQQNMTWDQFLEEQGGEQQFNMMAMLEVRESLVQGYALDALFRKKGLSLTPEDVNETCAKMNPRNPIQARKQLEESGRGFVLREAAERFKASKYLVDHAKITYKTAEEIQADMKAKREAKKAEREAKEAEE